MSKVMDILEQVGVIPVVVPLFAERRVSLLMR